MIDPLALHALADGELEKAEAQRLRHEVEGDTQAAAQLRSIESLKLLLKEKTQQPECGKEWRTCVGRLNELDKARRVEGFVGRYAWALCSMFFIAIVTGGLLGRSGGDRTVQTADLGRLASTLVPARAPHNAAPSEMDRWVDYHLRRARLSMDPSRLQVMAVAQGEMDGQRVVRLTLRDPSGDLALLVLPKPLSTAGLQPIRGTGYYAGSVDSLNLVAWGADERSFVLLSARRHESLQAIAERIQAH
jgi:hypothetical protein